MLDAITSPSAMRWTHLAGGLVAIATAIALVLPGGVGAAEPTPTATSPILPPPPTGTFTPSPPAWSAGGLGLAVYSGGNIDQLEVAAQLAGAKGVWVQDTTGRYALLPVNGPAFLKAGFASAFPAAGAANGANGMNFPEVIAVTLVR